MKYVLVVNGGGAAFGPFDSFEQAAAWGRLHYGTGPYTGVYTIAALVHPV